MVTPCFVNHEMRKLILARACDSNYSIPYVKQVAKPSLKSRGGGGGGSRCCDFDHLYRAGAVYSCSSGRISSGYRTRKRNVIPCSLLLIC